MGRAEAGGATVQELKPWVGRTFGVSEERAARYEARGSRRRQQRGGVGAQGPDGRTPGSIHYPNNNMLPPPCNILVPNIFSRF
jgi:hypothetical protein